MPVRGRWPPRALNRRIRVACQAVFVNAKASAWRSRSSRPRADLGPQPRQRTQVARRPEVGDLADPLEVQARSGCTSRARDRAARAGTSRGAVRRRSPRCGRGRRGSARARRAATRSATATTHGLRAQRAAPVALADLGAAGRARPGRSHNAPLAVGRVCHSEEGSPHAGHATRLRVKCPGDRRRTPSVARSSRTSASSPVRRRPRTAAAARPSASGSHGVAMFQARCAAPNERSLRIAVRPSRRAARPVIPEPQKASSTTSPGRVWCSMKGSIASGRHLRRVAVGVVRRGVLPATGRRVERSIDAHGRALARRGRADRSRGRAPRSASGQRPAAVGLGEVFAQDGQERPHNRQPVRPPAAKSLALTLGVELADGQASPLPLSAAARPRAACTGVSTGRRRGTALRCGGRR